MSWFKVSDGIAFHQKILRAGNEAVGAWVRAGAWASAPDNLTDGYIPPEVVSSIAPSKVWAKLRAAGLTEAPAGGRAGEQIHDFLAYNPSASQVKDDRDATRRRVESWRTKRRGNAVTDPPGNGVSNGDVTPPVTPPPVRAVSRPVPSRPVPISDPPVSPPGGATHAAAPPTAGPDPDLLALATTLAAEGSGLGQSVVDRAAQGRLPTPNQRAALVKIRDERALGGRPLPPPPGTPKPKAREPTRAEVERMLADAERDRSTMSPEAPSGPRVDVVGRQGGRGG